MFAFEEDLPTRETCDSDEEFNRSVADWHLCQILHKRGWKKEKTFKHDQSKLVVLVSEDNSSDKAVFDKNASNEDASTKDVLDKHALNEDASTKDVLDEYALTKDALTQDASTQETSTQDPSTKDASKKFVLKLTRIKLERVKQEFEIMVEMKRNDIPVPEVFGYGKANEDCSSDDWHYLWMHYIDEKEGILLTEFKGELTEEFIGHFTELVLRVRQTEIINKHWGQVDYLTCLCNNGQHAYCKDTNDFMTKRTSGLKIATESFINENFVLGHLDLMNGANLLVSPNGRKVVAILDWEMAGRYPGHYERCIYANNNEYETEPQNISALLKAILLEILPEPAPALKEMEETIYQAYS